jgi:hypothetical protein
VLVVAVTVGAAGGVLAELLQTQRGITGALEMPSHPPSDPNVLELGLLASMILGGGAGVAILYFLPPTVTVNGQISYDVVKGVALALLAGSLGRTLLTSLQSRLLVSLKDQQVRSTAAVAARQLDQQAKAAAADTAAAVKQAVSEHADPANAEQFAQQIVSAVADQAQGRAEDGKKAIAAVAPGMDLPLARNI